MTSANFNLFGNMLWCKYWLITMIKASNISYLIVFSSLIEIPLKPRLLLAGKSLIIFKTVGLSTFKNENTSLVLFLKMIRNCNLNCY